MTWKRAAPEMKSHSPSADENLLELIPEHCPDLLALLDVNGLFLYCNAAHFLRLLGKPLQSSDSRRSMRAARVL